jgi:hypothetical protein
MQEIKQLQRAVEKTADCKVRHFRSDTISEGFEGEQLWDGVVETFHLVGNPKATRCYAFYSRKDDGGPAIITVLGVPPIDSPLAALRAAIAVKVEK